MFKDRIATRDQELERMRVKCEDLEKQRRDRSREASKRRKENEELRSHLEHFESIQIGEDKNEGDGDGTER